LSCLACDLVEGRLPLPGGRIHESGGWIVEHTIGPLGLGTLIVKPERHVVRVAQLDDEQAAALGPLLRRVAAVVDELVRPEQVYVALWSHADALPGHIHFVVQPVTRATMDEFGVHGPKLQVAMLDRGDLPDEREVEAFADRARELLR
jgi:diadenosine tetraphosphate (Ap4A) HIT family hydrolase